MHHGDKARFYAFDLLRLNSEDLCAQNHYRSGTTVELRPANDAMKPVIGKPIDSLRIEGLVIGVIIDVLLIQ